MRPEIAKLEALSLAPGHDHPHQFGAEGKTQSEQNRPSQATQLVNLAADASLFHTPTNEGYATVFMNGHEETWLLRSKPFRHWLQQRFYEQTRTAPSTQAVQDAIGTLEARALFEGPSCPVHVRLADHQGDIYLDLGNEHWDAVRITSQGWDVTAAPLVKFRRPSGMLALPTPVRGGNIDDLRGFLNLAIDREQDWVLVVAWLLAALRPRGPYPVLVLHGEQGSGKSSLVEMLRSLVDPNIAPLRPPPRDLRDLMISAQNGWCLAFDNVSRIEPWLPDALCRLVTGSGFSTRQLYADTDEVLMSAQRPIVLSGIEEVASRPDLLDRSLLLSLPTIPDHRRKTDARLREKLEEERPRILGALLTVVSEALQHVSSVTLERLPRMADFAEWATAAEPALKWSYGTFLRAYDSNRDNANELGLEDSVLVAPVRRLMETRDSWSGTATELLSLLESHIEESVKRQPGWPKNGKGLSDRLRRIAPNLRALNFDVRWTRDMTRQHTRRMVIQRLERGRLSASAASAASESCAEFTTPLGPVSDGSEEERARVRPNVSIGQLEGLNRSDASDARMPLYSDAIPEVDLDAD